MAVLRILYDVALVSRGKAPVDNLIKQEILTQLDSEEQFPVDFDIYWQWLEFSTKGNAFTSL